jgi:hypothetical protein
MTDALNIPAALRALADHIAEHPAKDLYSVSPQRTRLALTFHTVSRSDALTFAATLLDPKVFVAHYAHSGRSADDPGFWGITVMGVMGTVPVKVDVSPDAVPGETAESVKAAVEAELAGLAAK